LICCVAAILGGVAFLSGLFGLAFGFFQFGLGLVERFAGASHTAFRLFRFTRRAGGLELLASRDLLGSGDRFGDRFRLFPRTGLCRLVLFGRSRGCVFSGGALLLLPRGCRDDATARRESRQHLETPGGERMPKATRRIVSGERAQRRSNRLPSRIARRMAVVGGDIQRGFQRRFESLFVSAARSSQISAPARHDGFVRRPQILCGLDERTVELRLAPVELIDGPYGRCGFWQRADIRRPWAGTLGDRVALSGEFRGFQLI
jgi:hypothetical protein